MNSDIFFLPGLSLALLLVTTGCGGGGGSSKPNSVPFVAPANQPPTAIFSTSSRQGPAPLTVTLDASDSSDSDGGIAIYQWDFGDDSAGAISAVTEHTYTENGTYTIRLEVTDDDGAVNTHSETVQVDPSFGSASLSGTIRILGSSAIDSDTNDHLTTLTANNDFANSQPLPNPATLGGFVNQPMTGIVDGHHWSQGDIADFYRVDLAGNESIRLDIADSDVDLDLRLWDADQNLIDMSMGGERVESLDINQPGRYVIEVLSVEGASNYVLTLGQNLTAGMSRSPTRLSDPFVTGEIIVQDKLLQAAGNSSASRPGKGRLRLVKTKMDHPLPVQAQHNPGHITPHQAARIATLNQLKALSADPSLADVELNLRRKPMLQPDDPFFTLQWHYPSIHLPMAWDITTGSSDVIVAVIDSGILDAHPDFAGQLVPGYDFISDLEQARDGDGIDPDPYDSGDLAFGSYSSFHGTHVAGTIAAATNNGLGTAGVAWDTRLMPLRALGVDGGSTYDVIQAMRYAAGLSNDSGTVPDQRANIINLSLGGDYSSQAEQAVIDEIRAAGIILIASAGNEASSLPSYPAAYDGVISVSATTINDSNAPYSNFGASIDIAAPGGDNATDLNADGFGDGVISTMGDDADAGPVQYVYAALSGTSMAAPHVSGIAALMLSLHPALTPAEFDAALMAGDLTDDAGLPGRDDRYGYGLVNAQKSVLAALAIAGGQGSDPGPIVAISTSALNFGPFGTELPVTITSIGTGDPVVIDLISNQPWVQLIAANTNANGLGDYRIKVDRSDLPVGTHNASVLVDTDANDMTVNIVMQVSNSNFSADAGLHYVIVVDEQGDVIGPAGLVFAVNGQYRYQLDNVPFGQYQLFAGSDSDDDSILCDAGEACGSYRSLDSPELLSINGDRQNLDFVSSLRINLSSLGASAQSDNGPAPGFAFTKAIAEPAAERLNVSPEEAP